MKSRRRHELQRNVLDAELAKLAAFIRRRATHLAGGLLAVAIIVFVVVSLVRGSRAADQRRQTQFYREVMRQEPPGLEDEKRINVLKSLAGQTDDERLAALATVAVGDAYATLAAAGRPHLSEAELRQLTDQASQWYEKAVAGFRDHPVAVAKARFGLAKLAESRGDLDQAREQYEAIREMEAVLMGQPVKAFALDEFKRIAEIREPVRMASTAPADANATTLPAGAPAGATQPATAPAATKPAAGQGHRDRRPRTRDG